MDDLLIRQATLYDGSGADPIQADLAVRSGRIRAIAPSLPQDAKHVIDADGLALMPGIIDSHTHYDAQLTWDPCARPSPALGVTTAVIGNCGFTIAPCRPQDRELTMRNLTQVEGMSFEVLQRGVRWEFETFAEYLAQLRRTGCAINIAAYAGHSSIRTYVMGAEANRRAATATEIEQMAALVREAMVAGAVGLASSTSPAHNGAGGAPMPSRLATDEEHLALIEAMGQSGRGVYMVTKGAQMPVALLEEMAARSRRPVMIAALLHNGTNPDAVFADLDAISAANQRGHRLIGQVSCCPLTMEFTMASPYPVEGLASWKPSLGKQGKELCAVLANLAFRQGVRQELAQPSAFRLFNGEWDKVHVVEVAQPRHRELEQRSVQEIAHHAGKDPLDAMLDLALDEDLATIFTAQLLNSDETAVARLVNHPHSLISLSDAGAHLTFFNDTGFGLHLLGHWVRERGVMPLQDAVRRLTHQSAEIFGLAERGLLRKGYAADLLLFDPATVGRSKSRRVFDLPGAAPRLHTDAIGVRGVWVNGQRVADSESVLAGTPLDGQVITEFQAAASSARARSSQ
jgi:N-acyl-D-amino-acid deacylase